MSTVAILNPKAGGGRTAQSWARVRAHLVGPVEAFETQAPGHAIELTRNAIKGGARTIIAVGGDGTINEVVNGFFEGDELISAAARLGIIPHGTSSDFCRILKLPLKERQLAAVIHHGDVRMVDVMKVRYTRSDGTSALRYSINITSFGMGGAVAERANRSSKPFGGTIAFLLATIQTALEFHGNFVTLKLDDSKTIDATVMNVAVGNGQYHGSGMWVCPGASIDDGFLDVTVIRYMPLFEVVKSLPALYNGGIYSHANVQACRVKRVQANSTEHTLLEIDGEPLGRLPLEISIVPQAIRVLVP